MPRGGSHFWSRKCSGLKSRITRDADGLGRRTFPGHLKLRGPREAALRVCGIPVSFVWYADVVLARRTVCAHVTQGADVAFFRMQLFGRGGVAETGTRNAFDSHWTFQESARAFLPGGRREREEPVGWGRGHTPDWICYRSLPRLVLTINRNSRDKITERGT